MATEQKVVKVGQVIPRTSSNRWAINKMAHVLIKQGQIEPLQVRVYAPGSVLHEASYMTFEQDAWADEIVWAAHQLGWDSLLVLITDKYIW